MKLDDSAFIVATEAVPYSENTELTYQPFSCLIEPYGLLCLVGPHRSQLRDYLFMLAGIYPPKRGQVKIFDRDTHVDRECWRKMRTRIGYLSGIAPLLSSQHGLMNVMLPALYHQNKTFRETADRARQLLSELECDFDFLSFPATLNNFQRLQLGLARALMLDPALLVFDVPFHDLGAKQREIMASLLGKYRQKRTVCMIGGLQYPRFLEQHATQISFISEQKIICFNSWAAFINSEDEEVQGLISGQKNVE